MIAHVMLISFGMLLMVLGFWGSFRFPKPYDTLVAWSAPIGLLVTLTGIVLLIIPDFFT